MTAKIYNIILTALFLCLILFSLLNDVFRFYKVPVISETENRKPASKPQFNINNLDPYPKLYEKYFNDKFPFRKDLGFMNTLICFFFFHQSPLPGEVELGKHGWLFYDQKESVVYQGKFKLADWQIANVVRELHDRTIEYGKKGLKFYVAFPPMKPEIYPEFLPMDFRRAREGTVTDKIVRAIKKDTVIQYIDLKDGLLKAKSRGRLYNLTDNHWNNMGAYYGYSEIISRIRKDFPEIRPITRSDFYFNVEKYPSGNLAVMIGLSKYLDEIQYIPVLKNPGSKKLDQLHKTPDWASYLTYYELIKSTGNPALPSIVIIDDSFTDALMPFLDESFDTTTYIFDAWKYQRNEEIIGDLKPDIVMLIIFEPHLSHLAGVW